MDFKKRVAHKDIKPTSRFTVCIVSEVEINGYKKAGEIGDEHQYFQLEGPPLLEEDKKSYTLESCGVRFLVPDPGMPRYLSPQLKPDRKIVTFMAPAPDLQLTHSA